MLPQIKFKLRNLIDYKFNSKWGTNLMLERWIIKTIFRCLQVVSSTQNILIN